MMLYWWEGVGLLVPCRCRRCRINSGRFFDRSRERHGTEAHNSKEDGLCEKHFEVLDGKACDDTECAID
jgi:hypothetical protein